MKNILLCLVPFLFCLSFTSAFAENTVGMKICVIGGSDFSDMNVDGTFFARGRAFPNVNILGKINFSFESKECIELFHHYKQKYTNSIYSTVGLYHESNHKYGGLFTAEILTDKSCNEKGFSSYVGGNAASIIVNNGYGETPVDWGVEYDLKAEFGKPVQMSCKLFFN